eukprot:scaffold240530_cov30-Tisochrysis_lutea.AAC.1
MRGSRCRRWRCLRLDGEVGLPTPPRSSSCRPSRPSLDATLQPPVESIALGASGGGITPQPNTFSRVASSDERPVCGHIKRLHCRCGGHGVDQTKARGAVRCSDTTAHGLALISGHHALADRGAINDERAATRHQKAPATLYTSAAREMHVAEVKARARRDGEVAAATKPVDGGPCSRRDNGHVDSIQNNVGAVQRWAPESIAIPFR